MGDIRKTYPPTFKVKVVLDAFKEEKTSAELASQYQVNPRQIRTWKMKARQGLLELFTEKTPQKQRQDQDKLLQELYCQIGQLNVELDWLKKKSGLLS
jgi:transposase